MPRRIAAAVLAALPLVAAAPAPTLGSPWFVNGLAIEGARLDATGGSRANAGRLGFFSDLFYDRQRDSWWALSDRGPGGGVLDHQTRAHRFTLKVDRKTGAISHFKIQATVRFTDPDGLLTDPTATVGRRESLNGLNPTLLNREASQLGQSFDPEGLVLNPRNGNLIVSDEYGPSLYEFKPNGRLIRVFPPPANLVPRKSDGVTCDYVSGRGKDGISFGRQDNRGYEGLAVTPSGKRLVAVLQDPLVNEPPPDDGRDGRNVRVVVYDNDPASGSYRRAIAQYVYQLEPQADVQARIVAAGGRASATDPRQGRNIGLSAIVALGEREFLVIERDNRGIGVDDPAGTSVIGTKRVYKIDLKGATDVTAIALPAGDLGGITPVAKSPVLIDLAADTVLPQGKQPEKWEGLAVGPRLEDGSYLVLAGTDNDYSVTQETSAVQHDVYVDFRGGSVQRDIDSRTTLAGVEVGPVPPGFGLFPGVLHAYKMPAAFLGGLSRR